MFGQVLRVTGTEEAALVERKLRRSTVAGVGNDGHQPRCKGLDATDRLYLHVRGVDIEVGAQQFADERLAVQIDELGLVAQSATHALVALALGSASRKDELDAVGIAAILHSADDDVLTLLAAQTSDHEHAYRALRIQGLRLLIASGYLLGTGLQEGVVYSVRNNVHTRAIAVLTQFVGDEGRGGVDASDAAVGEVAEDAIDHVVDRAHLSQSEVGRDILRLDMKGGGHGFAYLLAMRDDGIAQEERRIYMHHVGPETGSLDHLLPGVGIVEVMLLAHMLEYRKMEDAGAEVAVRDLAVLLRLGTVAADGAYTMSAAAQLHGVALGRDTCSVVRRIECVDDK